MFTLCARLSRHVCRRDRQRWERCAKSTAAAGPSELGESLGDGDVNPNHQALIWYKHTYIYYTYVLLDIFQIIWFPVMGVLAVIIHFWDFHEIKHLFWGTPIYGNPHMIYIFLGQSIYWVYHCVSLEDLCAKSQRSAWKRNIVFFTFSIVFSCFFSRERLSAGFSQ